jgi:hypothetical protein
MIKSDYLKINLKWILCKMTIIIRLDIHCHLLDLYKRILKYNKKKNNNNNRTY